MMRKYGKNKRYSIIIGLLKCRYILVLLQGSNNNHTMSQSFQSSLYSKKDYSSFIGTNPPMTSNLWSYSLRYGVMSRLWKKLNTCNRSLVSLLASLSIMLKKKLMILIYPIWYKVLKITRSRKNQSDYLEKELTIGTKIRIRL